MREKLEFRILEKFSTKKKKKCRGNKVRKHILPSTILQSFKKYLSLLSLFITIHFIHLTFIIITYINRVTIIKYYILLRIRCGTTYRIRTVQSVCRLVLDTCRRYPIQIGFPLNFSPNSSSNSIFFNIDTYFSSHFISRRSYRGPAVPYHDKRRLNVLYSAVSRGHYYYILFDDVCRDSSSTFASSLRALPGG